MKHNHLLDRSSVVGIYLKIKAFGWALMWTESLIRSEHLLKNEKMKTKKCQASKSFTKITNFLPKLIPKVILFLIQISTQF